MNTDRHTVECLALAWHTHTLDITTIARALDLSEDDARILLNTHSRPMIDEACDFVRRLGGPHGKVWREYLDAQAAYQAAATAALQSDGRTKKGREALAVKGRANKRLLRAEGVLEFLGDKEGY